MTGAPYRGADYSSRDSAFLDWWRNTCPNSLFGVARARYDAAQTKSVTLWSLQLGRNVRGMVKGPVASIRPAYAGRWSDAERDLVAPDPAAIRECLPPCYRKAWDRTGGSLWHGSAHVCLGARGNVSSVTLRGSRGQFLNTLYATPYIFEPTAT